MREEQRNKSHIDVGKDKGRTEKHYPYSHRERQGKNRKTLPIFIQGKTRGEQRNRSHFHMGKDKGRTKKQKPFSYKVRQGKDKGKTVKNKTLFSKRVEGKKRKKKEKGKKKKKRRKTFCGVIVNCLTQFTITFLASRMRVFTLDHYGRTDQPTNGQSPKSLVENNR